MLKLYKWLYTRIGGRPWTFILRDGYHQAPVPTIIVCMAIGAIIGRYLGMQAFLIFLGVGLFWVLIGHLFWGTKYVESQTDRRPR